jgi:hypothetical protein
MDKLYSKLSEQHSILQQKEAEKSSSDEALFARCSDYHSSSSSLPISPTAEVFSAPTAPTTRSASTVPNEGQPGKEEVLRLKLELAQAQNKISRLDQELAHTRIVTNESGSATPGLVAEPDYSTMAMTPATSPAAPRINTGGLVLGAPGRIPTYTREQGWTAQDTARSDAGDPMSVVGLNRSRGIWNSSKPVFGSAFSQGPAMVDAAPGAPWANSRPINYEPAFAPSGMDVYRPDRMAPPDQDVMRPLGRRGNRWDNRYGSSSSYAGGFGGYSMSTSHYESAPSYSAGPQGMMAGGMGMGLYAPYQQQPVGTPLSPLATEFTSAGTSWKNEVSRNSVWPISRESNSRR